MISPWIWRSPECSAPCRGADFLWRQGRRHPTVYTEDEGIRYNCRDFVVCLILCIFVHQNVKHINIVTMKMQVWILLLPIVAGVIGGYIGGREYKKYQERRTKKWNETGGCTGWCNPLILYFAGLLHFGSFGFRFECFGWGFDVGVFQTEFLDLVDAKEYQTENQSGCP